MSSRTAGCGLWLLGWLGAGCAASAVEPDTITLADQADPQGEHGHATLERVSSTRCPGRTLRTRADLAAMRDCEQIDGDLIIEPRDFTALGHDDLPRLRRIHGTLLVFEAVGLERLELPALQRVGSDAEGGIEIAFDRGTLREVVLPALHSVQGYFLVAALPQLQRLQLPSLARVSGSFSLLNLPALTSLDLDPGAATGQTQIQALCALPADLMPETVPEDPETSRTVSVGCCTDAPEACRKSDCHCPG